jgi:hypothetical protein
MRCARLCGFVGPMRPSTSSTSALLRGVAAANRSSLPSTFRLARSASSLTGVKEPLEDVLRKAQYRQITEALEREDGRVRLSLTEYLELCKKYNVGEAEGRELLKALHNSGRVLHYESTPALANTLIVKPDALAASFVKLLDVQGEYTKNYVHAKEQELGELRQQLQVLETTRKELETKAYKRADTWIRLGFTYIVVQAGLVARLTWWELSWDIMEPVTYMLTFATCIGGMAYFTHTKTEYTYEGLRRHLAEGRLRKLYRKYNFDIDRYEELQRAVERTEQELKTPEVSLLKFQTIALQ